jgi:hypothetical protein
LPGDQHPFVLLAKVGTGIAGVDAAIRADFKDNSAMGEGGVAQDRCAPFRQDNIAIAGAASLDCFEERCAGLNCTIGMNIDCVRRYGCREGGDITGDLSIHTLLFQAKKLLLGACLGPGRHAGAWRRYSQHSQYDD